MLLDFDPRVVAVSSQPFWLHWKVNDQARRHAPDFFVRCVDGSAVVIDVRPDERIAPRDAQAFAATAAACCLAGWEYRRVGAVDRIRAANVRWLAGIGIGDAGAKPGPLPFCRRSQILVPSRTG